MSKLKEEKKKKRIRIICKLNGRHQFLPRFCLLLVFVFFRLINKFCTCRPMNLV